MLIFGVIYEKLRFWDNENDCMYVLYILKTNFILFIIWLNLEGRRVFFKGIEIMIIWL